MSRLSLFRNTSDPFGLLALFEEFSPLSSALMNASPRIKASDKPDKFVIKAEVPGFEEDQIKVDTSGRRLTISGSKGIQEGEDEFSSSRFEKSFTIPQSVAADKISALLKSGVLTITLPKRQDNPEKKTVKIFTE